MSVPRGNGGGPPTRRAQVVGTGLIGGSIGAALRGQGWHVTGRDHDPDSAQRALELGVIDAVGSDPDAELTFVATPVGAIAGEVEAALGATRGVVTDVGSVKAPLAALMGNPRFVGGHPMAGSEMEGVAGADPAMFEGAVWVLTPTGHTADEAFALVSGVVSSFGAEVMALRPDRHDQLVALVSHVPHLTAVTLMGQASARAEEHRALLRLAAGGFRDMTRIASGHPGIWPDICAQNRVAIVAELDGLIRSLGDIRDVVATGDRDALVERLSEARAARQALPARFARPEDAAEIRVPVPDEPGVLARVLTLAAELGVSIADIEIAHSVEGDRGVLILVVEADQAARLVDALAERGDRPTVRRLDGGDP